ncbi:uncharacterized protein [Solanum lycopersicum]|uniref:uncharacterized protein n=1 Tax=Solanum lycopersicum TaxID=4081 RepID=UPI000532C26D|nr:uncharacterized protein LOC104645256 [Solanum lycopersicum]
MASNLRDFTRINLPTLYGSKVEVDPQKFIDEIYKILYAMGFSTSEKFELAIYKLKDVSQALHFKHVDKARSKRNSRDSKKERSLDGGSSKNRLETQENPRFKKRVSNQVPSKLLMASGYMWYNRKPKKGKGTSSPSEKPSCKKCGKKHYGICLEGTDNCFGCGKSGHKVGIVLMWGSRQE